MNQTFGEIISEARLKKLLSQRDLAKLVNIEKSYVSKLENDRISHCPSESLIESLAKALDIPDCDRLKCLAGRISTENMGIIQELLKLYPTQIPIVLRQMRDNPEFAQQLIDCAIAKQP